VALGRIFFGESMFTRERDASKVALAHLCDVLVQRDFVLIDCQMVTAHLMSLGARTLPRTDFTALLERHAQPPDPTGEWRFS
jgi:leucyl/phenylalanyl-tRNA---protein transferase